MRRVSASLGIAMVVAAAVIPFIAGCYTIVPVDPPAGYSATGRSVTTRLGSGGVFNFTRNVTVNNIVDITLFSKDPTDHPCWCDLLLALADLQVQVWGGSSSGTVTVQVLIDSAGTASPCTTGEGVGTFQIRVTNGVASVIVGSLRLSAYALQCVLSNDFSMCINVTADFDGRLTIAQFTFSFASSTSGCDDPTPPLTQCEELWAAYERAVADGNGVPGQDACACEACERLLDIFDAGCVTEGDDVMQVMYQYGWVDTVADGRAWVQGCITWCGWTCQAWQEQREQLVFEKQQAYANGDYDLEDQIDCQIIQGDLNALNAGCEDLGGPDYVEQMRQTYQMALGMQCQG